MFTIIYWNNENSMNSMEFNEFDYYVNTWWSILSKIPEKIKCACSYQDSTLIAYYNPDPVKRDPPEELKCYFELD